VAVGTLITISKTNTIEDAEENAKKSHSEIIKPELKATIKRIFQNGEISIAF